MFVIPPAEKPSRLPWLIAGGAALVVIGIVLILGYGQGYTPGASGALSPYAARLVISHIEMSQANSMVGGPSTYIDGTIANTGSKTVTGVTVQAIFDDFNKQPTQTSTLQMLRIRTREPYIDTETLSAVPIGPGQSAPFRLILDHVSDSWNQNPPVLRILEVDFK